MPALVSEEIWQTVQARMRLNRQRSVRNARDPEAALLRGGYVICGLCGRTIAARPRSEGGAEYLCARGLRNADCVGNYMSAPKLDRAVWNRVATILTDPQVIEQEVARQCKHDPTSDDLVLTERALHELERQQGNLVRAIAELDNREAAAALSKELVTLQQRRTDLVSEQERLLNRRSLWEASQNSLTRIADWSHTIATQVDQMTWTEKRLALDALGVRVTLFPVDHQPRFVITADIPLESASHTT